MATQQKVAAKAPRKAKKLATAPVERALRKVTKPNSNSKIEEYESVDLPKNGATTAQMTLDEVVWVSKKKQGLLDDVNTAAPVFGGSGKLIKYDTESILPFQKLSTNAKGGGEYAVGPYTAIVGPNKVGKTALLTAIQLAIAGELPGRSNPSDLLRLAPPDAPGLTASIEGKSGVCKLFVDVIDGKPKQPVHFLAGAFEHMDGEALRASLPTLCVADLLKSPAKVREHVFARFGDLKEVPTPVHLDGGQEQEWCAAVKELTGVGANKFGPSAVLAGMETHFRGIKLAISRTKGEATREYEGLKKQAAGVLCPSDVELAKLKTRAGTHLGPLFAMRETYNREATSCNEILQRLPDELRPEPQEVDFLAECDAERDAIAAAWQKIGQTDNEEERDKALLVTLDHILERCKVAGECVCGGAFGAQEYENVSATRDAVAKRVSHTLSVSRTLNERAAKLDAKLMKDREAFGLVHKGWYALKQDFARTDEMYARLAPMKKALLDAFATAGVPFDAPAFESEGTGGVAALDAALAHKAIHEKLTAARDRTKKQEREFEIARVLEGEARELLQIETAKVAKAAELTVNGYMPDAFKAKLVLDGNDCYWAVVGRDGLPHGEGDASGSEFAALYIALSLVWSEDAPFRVLLVDDDILGRFDPAGVHEFLRTIAKAVDNGVVTQVFVAWTRPDEIPNTWAKIVLGGEES